MDRTEREVLTEVTLDSSDVVLRSSWWLVAKNCGDPLEVFALDTGDTLPVFSGEGEAELFLWLREAHEHGWEVRESSCGELVSVLSGPCSQARLVALDPSTEVLDAKAVGRWGLSREDFLEWMVSGSRRTPDTGIASG